MKELILNANLINASLGDENKFRTKNEKYAFKRRRSIFVIKDIRLKEKFTNKNINVLRPNKGIHPKHYFSIIGKKSKLNLKKGTPLKKKHIFSK